MQRSIPRFGAHIEALGVLGSFVGADRVSTGDVYFTVRLSASNAQLLASKLTVAEEPHTRVSQELIYLSHANCTWGAEHAEMFDADSQTMIGFSDRGESVARSTRTFQAMLSRRNRL